MKLIDYIEWKKVKPYLWADSVGLPRSGVYSWITGKTPTIKNIMRIRVVTSGAVGPDDWINGDTP